MTYYECPTHGPTNQTSVKDGQRYCIYRQDDWPEGTICGTNLSEDTIDPILWKLDGGAERLMDWHINLGYAVERMGMCQKQDVKFVPQDVFERHVIGIVRRRNG